ncbi:MAG: DUF87 domain-containing protein, partial [Candidatus Geothermarchaeota archaeon]
MIVFRKNENIIELIAFPNEHVKKGEYLLIEDENTSLVVQVIDVSYVDSLGILEDLIRESIFKSFNHVEFDTTNAGYLTKAVRDMKIVTTVIRGSINNNSYTPTYDELPSRVAARVREISAANLLKLCRNGFGHYASIGYDLNGNEVYIDIGKLDGSLTLITGMKGTGKSHLAKLLISNLINYNVPILVFDLNGEYYGLLEIDSVRVLEPGKNLFFSLSYLGRETVLNLLVHILGLPGLSANLFKNIWLNTVKTFKKVTIKSLIKMIDANVKNLMIKDALISRLMILGSARFIVDDDERNLYIETLFDEYKCNIVSLKTISPLERKLLVEAFLSKLSRLLEERVLKPLFLVAEEAHMYVRETYWEDIITRMRHYGLYILFVTNQPNALNQTVFRQLDNVFVFKFQNEYDIEMVSKISNIDVRTVKSVVKDLKVGRALVIGPIVEWLPIVMDFKPLPFKAMGETR